VTGGIIQASWANTHVRDNSRYLKGLDGDVAIDDDLGVTGDVTASAGVNVGGLSGAIAGEVKAKMGRFTELSPSTGGAGVEVGVSGGRAIVQGYNRTLDEYIEIGLNGSEIKLFVSGVEKGSVDSTGFQGNGSQLTSLTGSQVTGAVPDAAVSGKNVSLFTNNSGYLTAASSLDPAKLTGPILATTQTILNNASYTICAASEGGIFIIRDDLGSAAILYIYNLSWSEITDPTNVFTFIQDTANSYNLVSQGGNIFLQNKTANARVFQIVRIAGG
jgi:hypothetical protein